MRYAPCIAGLIEAQTSRRAHLQIHEAYSNRSGLDKGNDIHLFLVIYALLYRSGVERDSKISMVRL